MNNDKVNNENVSVESTPEKEINSTTPANLIQLAIQKDVDVDKLEKLLQLQERWQANEARKVFFESLSKFQSECPILEKKKKVDFPSKSGGRVNYKYAQLSEITQTMKEKMRECSFSHRWEINDREKDISVTCIISHANGHSERTTMSAFKDDSGGKNEIQQRGSTITYLQRYTLIAALGISTADEDVDGQREEKPQGKKEVDVKPIPPVKKKEEPIAQILTSGQKEQLAEAIRIVDEAPGKTELMDWAKTQKDWIKINTNFREAVRKKSLTFPSVVPLSPDIVEKHEQKESYFSLPWLPEKDFKDALEKINAGNVALFPELETKYRIKSAYKSALEQAHEFSLKVNR